MNKEKISEIMNNVDVKYIDEAMHVDDNIASVRAEEKHASKKISPVKRSLSKTAVAAIVAVCVLVMGGGAVWAMTASPLKEYFFKNSGEKAFKDVYKEIGKTYTIGTHTVTLDGMTYDEATGIGYVSFSAFDTEGNPTNFIADEPRVYLGDPILTGDIWTESYKLGDDQVYFIKLNVKSCYGHTGESTLYWQLREDRELYGSPVLFTVVDKDTLDRISDEIAHLDIELNKVYSPEKDEYLYGCVDYDKALPKVKDILNKYDLVTLDFEAMPSQVIETANCTFIFGRTDGILKYNSNEFDADSFVIKRENGEEITVEKGHVDSELWKVADMDNMSWLPETSSDGDGNNIARYNYGFILGVDEKVSVVINGKTYK